MPPHVAVDSTRREIVGLEIDEAGDTIAVFACDHRQHVRHDPPWRMRPWAVTEEGRRGALGGELECPLCDRETTPERRRR